MNEQHLTPSKQAYQWIGKDGGFLVGHIVARIGHGRCIMSRWGRNYDVPLKALSIYPVTPIEEPKK